MIDDKRAVGVKWRIFQTQDQTQDDSQEKKCQKKPMVMKDEWEEARRTWKGGERDQQGKLLILLQINFKYTTQFRVSQLLFAKCDSYILVHSNMSGNSCW